ncbi:MAG: delta-aminolevulinic acid dehydratase [Pirellulaceae bacterium]|nr:MAG: delta-aminolevulinic acid dehydratase [Pirellulaceae bacterium]
MVAETTLTTADLIWPVFVVEGHDVVQPVDSMPDVYRYSIDRLIPEVDAAIQLGIPAIALFPVVPSSRKSPSGDEAINPENLMCRALRALRSEFGDAIGLVADVALDPYTSHGHDGLLENDRVVNDATVEILCRQAVVQAEAGCTVIAPSDMMDGRIGRIRRSLDEAGYAECMIMAYAAKFASAFYGPFRDAVGSKQHLGTADKKTYQMDPANAREALHEVALDIAEGADLVMVKPGLPYLDIVYRIREAFGLPTAVYQVSGEYAMISAAAQNGWLDGPASMWESLLAMKRAGADVILTYAARAIARQLEVTDQ